MDRKSNQLVKSRLADILRSEIFEGKLQPGQRVVEGHWAAKLGVAQASIREALNILAGEGFIEKDSGRSARVTKLTFDDVLQLYEVRAVLEGTAARLVAEKRPDLCALDQAVADMGAAVECDNLLAYYQRDLEFHVLMAKMSGNRFLVHQIRWLLAPLFAFYVMGLHEKNTPQAWGYSLEGHREILRVLRTATPAEAQAYMEGSVRKFFEETHRMRAAADPTPVGALIAP